VHSRLCAGSRLKRLSDDFPESNRNENSIFKQPL
jgi:hypothetical protein